MYCFLISSHSKFTECKYPCSNIVQNEHLRGCDQCQRFKSAPHPRTDPLPIAVPEGPWQVIGVDLVTGLPKSEGLDGNKYNYDFGVYEESFCAVGTQGAFQLRHAKKYKLWEHTL